MNIFYVHPDPVICAQQHVDKHVVKMILEYAQLLSTAHRVLDGSISVGVSDKGRKKTSYKLADDRDAVLYSATHLNHPSAKWARHSLANYQHRQCVLLNISKTLQTIFPPLKVFPLHGEQCLTNISLIAVNLTTLLSHTVHISLAQKVKCLNGKIVKHPTGFTK
jgi:hypothetical protein